MNKIKLIAVLLVVILMFGCIQIVVPPSQTNATTAMSTAKSEAKNIVGDNGPGANITENKYGNNLPMISENDAINIALRKVPGATKEQISIKLDHDDGRTEYEIKIYKDNMKYEMDIDANTGEIRDYEEKRK